MNSIDRNTKIIMRYFKFINPPTPKIIDKISYLSMCFKSIIIVIYKKMINDPMYKLSFKGCVASILPRLVTKDILINFKGVKFIARRGKTDISILNDISEPWLDKYFEIGEKDFLIDIGAHIGKYALIAAKRAENGRVIAIEPNPDNYEQLLKNISINRFSNVIPIKVAAFNEDDKELPLYGGGDQLGSLKFHHTYTNQLISVKTKRVDSILKDLKIKEYPTWVKIDVERAEVEVLEGMSGIITNSPNLKLLIEVVEENKEKVDNILKNFNKLDVGGDFPSCREMLYWKE